MNGGEKRVQLPGGEIVAFPDSMGDDAISSAIQRNFPQYASGAQQQPTNEAGLSPEVEALRQKNLQAGLAQAASPATRTLQGLDIQPDVQAITGTGGMSIPGAAAMGGAGAINLLRKAAGAPLTLAEAGNLASTGLMGQIPGIGPTLAGLGRLPSEALQGVGGLVGGVLENAGAGMGLTPDVREGLIQALLKTTPQQAQYINQAGTGLATDVGTAGALAGLGAGIKGVGDYAASAPERGLAKTYEGIRQVAPPSKAVSQASKARAYDQNIKDFVPHFGEELKANPPSATSHLSTVEQMGIASENALDKIWQKATEPLKKFGDVAVNPSDVVDKSINEGIPDNVKLLHPDVVEKIKTALEPYKQDMTLNVLHQEISDLNAQQSRFYKADPGQQSVMMRDDPALTAKLDLADNLRELMFDKLEEQGVTGVEKLRKDYGAGKAVNDRIWGNMERNKALDKKGIFSGYGSPLRKGFYGALLTRLVGGSPLLAGAVDVGVVGGEAVSAMRGKPSAVAGRTMEAAQKYAPPPSGVEYTAPTKSSSGAHPTEMPPDALKARGYSPEEIAYAQDWANQHGGSGIVNAAISDFIKANNRGPKPAEIQNQIKAYKADYDAGKPPTYRKGKP